MSPFRDFEEKEQWIIFLISVCIGILIAIGIGWTGLILISISAGLICSAIGYITAIIHRKLSILAKNIDLQVRKTDIDTQQIAENLEYLINLSKQEKMKKIIKKSLNGAIQILDTKGLEDRELRVKVLSIIMSTNWKKVISTSTFGPAEWMDPYWFSYLTLQVARSAELKPKVAKRYFIYRKNVIDEYSEELRLLIESHGNYMETFLFYTEDIENDLEKKGLKCVDFVSIGYNNTDNVLLWRNPDKKGQVEQLTFDQDKQSIENFIRFLESKERTLNRKVAL